MGQKVTIGGKRLGSGSGTEVNLHGFGRSTHNLSHTWKSSMGVGMLVPCYTTIGLNGDTFDIDLESMSKTVPCNGALFGSYKLQIDVFEAPIRLYHGALHNNQLGIGMQMSQIKFPLYQFETMTGWGVNNGEPHEVRQVEPNSLLAHLGFNGAGVHFTPERQHIHRDINALPILAYYDIFKNYYANKQEKQCYMVSGIEDDYENLPDGDIQAIYCRPYMVNPNAQNQPGKWQMMADKNNNQVISVEYMYGGSPSIGNEWQAEYKITGWDLNETNVEVWDSVGGAFKPIGAMGVVEQGYGYVVFRPNIDFPAVQDNFMNIFRGVSTQGHYHIRNVFKRFNLDDLDKMREEALTWRSGIQPYLHTHLQGLEPFDTICSSFKSGNSFFKTKCGGLMLKTYQSDLFNNFVQTDYIDDPNTGIAAVTAVDTSSGSFTMDSLNLQKKVYDMLNRIAVSGGTFEDWQEAVYGEDAVRKVESPLFCGGYSSEIVFDEIVANTMSADGTPQGTLSGKGTGRYEKNGHAVIHVKEPSIIMCIASITPRVDYNAMNEWYMTNLFDMDDLHKPSLDGIGFEDLLQERACWLGTKNDDQTLTRYSVGKIPAWLNYMTDVDQAHGDFADTRKLGWMLNLRKFDFNERTNKIEDFTTYIDPKKYNMCFADTSMTAQNFWVQIGFHITARRKMSAKVIPNL